MKIQKMTTGEKVYDAAKKMFKVGKPLPLSAIAKKVGVNSESVRRYVIQLVSKKLIKRENGKIINVK